MKKILINILMVAVLALSNTACKKYLDQKPSGDLDIPNTWQDLQALLDQTGSTNFAMGTDMPEMLSDNYYVTDSRWERYGADFRGTHIWNDIDAQVITSWSIPYQSVYQVNVVLDHLYRIKATAPAENYNNIEGSALFFRSMAFFNLLQVYAKPYTSSAGIDLGIVLKLNASISDYAGRSTVQQCYEQVINDLKKAETLLPRKGLNVHRPSSAAASALLARIYLSMADYQQAKIYAEYALSIQSNLLDYNTLIPSTAPLMPNYLTNPEIIFFSVGIGTSFMGASNAIIDPDLYKSYADNDIRKKAFFTTSSVGGAGTYRFKGSYQNTGIISVFTGMTSAEMYLILAECLVRSGSTQSGLDALNTLLKKRYTATFSGYATSNRQEALNIVLAERRKELVYRNQRWTDVRRLNLEGRNIELRRYLKGTYYMLPPNDLRGVLLIPNDEIIRTGLVQNPR